MNQLFTKRELATYLKVSLRAIERWQSQGMPVVKLGTACRYDLAAVLGWHRRHQEPEQKTLNEERSSQL